MKYRESLNIVNKDLQLPAILAINSSINAEESLSRVFEVLQDFLDADVNSRTRANGVLTGANA